MFDDCQLVSLHSFFGGASRGFHDYDVPPAGPPLQKKPKKQLKTMKRGWMGDHDMIFLSDADTHGMTG